MENVYLRFLGSSETLSNDQWRGSTYLINSTSLPISL